MTKRMTSEDIHKMFTYCPTTGCIFKGGKPTGSPAGHGYIYVRYGRNNRWLAHRLSWFLHYGEWPKGNVDHINRDKTDNRIGNLRVVTQSQNLLNHGKPLSGIYKHRRKWRVKVGRSGDCGSFYCFGKALKIRNSKMKDVVK